MANEIDVNIKITKEGLQHFENILPELTVKPVKVSIEGNGLCTSVYYKPTDSHSYLLYSSSHPSHVKNSIPDFSLKSEEMCNFFNKRGYPASVVEAGHHRAQQIGRQSALQTSQRDNNDIIPFTLTFHPHNHAVKSIILKNFKFKMIPILAESFRNLH